MYFRCVQRKDAPNLLNGIPCCLNRRHVARFARAPWPPHNRLQFSAAETRCLAAEFRAPPCGASGRADLRRRVYRQGPSGGRRRRNLKKALDALAAVSFTSLETMWGDLLSMLFLVAIRCWPKGVQTLVASVVLERQCGI